MKRLTAGVIFVLYLVPPATSLMLGWSGGYFRSIASMLAALVFVAMTSFLAVSFAPNIAKRARFSQKSGARFWLAYYPFYIAFFFLFGAMLWLESRYGEPDAPLRI